MPKHGEMDGFDLKHYHVGQVYTLPSRLATLLILDGHAELVDPQDGRAEAPDRGRSRFPKTR